VTIASLLAQNTRAGDTVARYGGEEFAVILPNASEEAAILIGEKLRMAVQNHPWEMKPVTISVGISTASFEKEKEKMRHTDLGVKLIQEADQALYESKSRGRNLTTHISQKG
jgi:diguanylate cyclase (GGDEF)-like protein